MARAQVKVQITDDSYVIPFSGGSQTVAGMVSVPTQSPHGLVTILGNTAERANGYIMVQMHLSGLSIIRKYLVVIMMQEKYIQVETHMEDGPVVRQEVGKVIGGLFTTISNMVDHVLLVMQKAIY